MSPNAPKSETKKAPLIEAIQSSRVFVVTATIIVAILASTYLHALFIDRVTANDEQEFKLELQLNLSALALEIERRNGVKTVLDSYFRNSDTVEEVEFQSFLNRLPNVGDLKAICWRSNDLSADYRVGLSNLCDYFSFAEQDKIISEESMLMTSIYTESQGGQQGFITVFISLQDLLISLKQNEKYVDRLLIFNNSSQQFERLSRAVAETEVISSQFLDLTKTEPLSRIGDVEVFYTMEPNPELQGQLSVTELMVSGLTFIVILVTGIFLSHQLNVSQRIRRQVQEQTQSLVESREQSDKLRQEAEHLAEHKQRFLANMSHEIRTPMNGVLGVVQLLESEDLSEKQLEYVRLIGHSGNLMVGILNDILDQSKIDAGKIELHLESCDLNDLLNQMCTMFRSAALSKNITLNLDLDPSLPSLIELDPMRFKQVLGNLISNGLKFTHEGSVSIASKRINDMVRVSVTDTGIGISGDKISDIFTEFTQADSSTTKNYGGTGLGLSISYNLLQLMKSELKVESILGKGCSFYFDLEIKELSPNKVPKQPDVAGKTSDAKASKFEEEELVWPQNQSVLVVEDNDINAMFIMALLEQFGIKSELAENGEVALQKFKEESFQFILMDCQMPVMDGFDATRYIREIEQPQPYIVALTANALPEDRQACMDAGMDEFLSKPVMKDALKRILRKYVEEISQTSVELC